ncbi:hypothetical protein EDS67_19500 [candidate division KSB1 bacterium]|nr:MAG: hypothetical protein EDS67_19500 [candidate division KSB1 bacterium]MBC6947022.1 hypothetical protein [candidate division KSB1 bacterium]MCE7942759.1 hypothetical protein [Chlorobi bacterium CHB1]
MKELSLEAMQELNGGQLPFECALALAGYGIAIAGAAAATGGIGVFIIGQLGLFSGAAGIICSCSDMCG